MGEAKMRAVEGDGYGSRQAYVLLGPTGWYVGVSAAMRRECLPGGSGPSIAAMIAEREAMRDCPSVFGKTPKTPEAGEREMFALAKAVVEAPDGAIVTMDDATLAIATSTRAAFKGSRFVGVAGAGRYAARLGEASAAFNGKRGTFLAMRDSDGRHEVVDAASFLPGKAVATPEGLAALADPLSMQVAAVLRQLAASAAGVSGGRALSESWQALLRQPFDAIVAHAESRYADRRASADLAIARAAVSGGDANRDALARIGAMEGMPFHASLRAMAEAALVATAAEGGPEEAFCRHMGSPMSRWDRGDLSSVDVASRDLGGPGFPHDAYATTVEPTEAGRTTAFLGAGGPASVVFASGARCRFSDRPEGRYALFDDGSGTARLVAWRRQ